MAVSNTPNEKISNSIFQSFFYIPSFSLKLELDDNVRWCFFGANVVHGTTCPIHLDASNFKRSDTAFKTKQCNIDFKYVNVAWGQYTRAAPSTIYKRNKYRLSQHNEGVNRLSEYGFNKVTRSIANYEKFQRDERAKRRRR